MLHIISQSLFKNRSVGTGVTLVANEDALLLIGDGLYGASHPDLAALTQVFAIDEDRITRGLPPQKHITYINYAEMVELTAAHSPVITWA